MENSMENLRENRKRTSNFTRKEESLLTSLVKKYKSVIENKKSDTNTNAQKGSSWMKIEKEFNATSGEAYRDHKVLKKKYENLKKIAKKKFADEKCYTLGTGGGPHKNIEITDVDNDIKEMLGIRVDGLISEFDGDCGENEPPASNPSTDREYRVQAKKAISKYKENDIMENEQIIIEVVDGNESEENMDRNNLENVSFDEQPNKGNDLKTKDTGQMSETEQMVGYHEPENSNFNDWSKYTPEMLRNKKPEVLRPRKLAKKTQSLSDPTITSKISQWAESKAAMEASRREFELGEHELRMKCFLEKHKLELEVIQTESDARLKMKAAEHEIRMEILQIEKLKMLKNK